MYFTFFLQYIESLYCTEKYHSILFVYELSRFITASCFQLSAVCGVSADRLSQTKPMTFGRLRRKLANELSAPLAIPGSAVRGHRGP